MSEHQMTKPVEAKIKISSLDNHRITSHGQAPAAPRQAIAQHPPTHKPRAGATPANAHNGDVVITHARPIDARMQPSGVTIKGAQVPPTRRTVESAAVTARRAAVSGGASPMTTAERANVVPVVQAFDAAELGLLLSLVDQFGQRAGGKQLETAISIYRKLHAQAAALETPNPTSPTTKTTK